MFMLLVLMMVVLSACGNNQDAEDVNEQEETQEDITNETDTEENTEETEQGSDEGETNGNTSGSHTANTVVFSQGEGTVINPGIIECKGGRVSAVGEVTEEDGSTWTVPTSPADMETASDLLNQCTDVQFNSIDELDLDSIPVVEIDEDGEIITGYIFADNYFELYVNGEPVAKDAVPFTPFNSHVVRFKASYPMTYAIKAVDWEENVGLGTESNKGSDYHPGDAGIVAVFSDGTVTNGSWLAQSYYISPLAAKEDLTIQEKDGKIIHTSPDYRGDVTCTTDCYAAHFELSDNWYGVDFDDSTFPNAVTYTTGQIGVDNKNSYTNFSETFGQGEFVWTQNLVYDNVIILRHTVNQPQ